MDRRAFLRNALLAAGAVAAPKAAASQIVGPLQPKKLSLHAYYYLWYHGGSWNYNADYLPQLGFYLSGNTKTALRHIRLAERNGIDGFLVNWHRRDDDTLVDENFVRHFLPAARRFPDFHYCFHYDTNVRFLMEDNGVPDFTDEATLDEFRNDIHYLKRYFGDPQYLRINGRPVLVMYLSRVIDKGFGALVDAAKDIAYQSLGAEIYFVGDEIWWDQWRHSGKIMREHLGAVDAVTAYSLVGGWRSSSVDVRTYTNKCLQLYQDFDVQSAAMAARRPVIQNVLARYDDRKLAEAGEREDAVIINPYLGFGFPDYYGDAKYVIERLAGQSSIIGDGETGFMFITSFNEWPERTSFEPTRPGFDRDLVVRPHNAYLTGVRDAKREYEAQMQ